MSTTTMTETREKSKERIGVRGVVQIGMLSAIAIILMQFEVPLPFCASVLQNRFQ